MIGRVKEGERKWCADAGGFVAKVGGRTAMDARVSVKAKAFDIVADGPARAMICFNEQAERGAPAHGFEAQRARACEQVDHPGAFQIRCPVGMGQQIEDGLPGAVARRAGALAFGGLNGAALELTGYDAHFSPHSLYFPAL